MFRFTRDWERWYAPPTGLMAFSTDRIDRFEIVGKHDFFSEPKEDRFWMLNCGYYGWDCIKADTQLDAIHKWSCIFKRQGTGLIVPVRIFLERGYDDAVYFF